MIKMMNKEMEMEKEMMKEMKMENRRVYGVGYLGDTLTVDENGNRKKSYVAWKEMVRRCYSNKKEAKKHRAYENCTVCDRWLCFANFEKDIVNLPGYEEWLKGEERYSLDKDILQYGSEYKIYSPETCMFVPQSLNAQATQKETREFVCVNAETGELRVIDNLHEEWGAKAGNIVNVCKGIGNQAYGHYWWYDDFIFEVMDKFDKVKNDLTEEQMLKMNKMIDECNIQKLNKYLDKILLSTYQKV